MLFFVPDREYANYFRSNLKGSYMNWQHAPHLGGGLGSACERLSTWCDEKLLQQLDPHWLRKSIQQAMFLEAMRVAARALFHRWKPAEKGRDHSCGLFSSVFVGSFSERGPPIKQPERGRGRRRPGRGPSGIDRLLMRFAARSVPLLA